MVTGRPEVSVPVAAGAPAVAIRQTDGWEASPFPHEPTVLSPGGSAQIELGPGSWCGKPDQSPTRVQLTLPPGVAVTVDGFVFGPCFEGATFLDVSGYGPISPVPSPNVPAPTVLEIQLLAPAKVSTGAVIEYWVIISNPSGQSAILPSCSTFTQGISATGVLEPQPLPCAAIGSQIEPGGSVALEMHLMAPAVAGRGTLVWSGLSLAAKTDVIVQ